MNRRGFLKGMAGILAAGVAPAVLPSGVIMPVRNLWTPRIVITGKDGIDRPLSEWSLDGLQWTENEIKLLQENPQPPYIIRRTWVSRESLSKMYP